MDFSSPKRQTNISGWCLSQPSAKKIRTSKKSGLLYPKYPNILLSIIPYIPNIYGTNKKVPCRQAVIFHWTGLETGKWILWSLRDGEQKLSPNLRKQRRAAKQPRRRWTWSYLSWLPGKAWFSKWDKWGELSHKKTGVITNPQTRPFHTISSRPKRILRLDLHLWWLTLIDWLVVGPPLWKIFLFVNWDDDIPNIWEHKKCSKPPTSC